MLPCVTVTYPCLVIHGNDDPLMLPICGQDTADNLPKEWFLRVKGMGHDLPDQMTPVFVVIIAAN